MRRRDLAMLALALAAASAFASAAAAQWTEDWELLVKVKGIENYYDLKQLKSFATEDLGSQRGTKTGGGIPLTKLVTLGGNITPEEIENILLVGGERTMLLEGSHLQHLDKLWVKLGRLRPSVYPEDDATWRALQPEFGAPRLKDLEQVFVYAKGELR